MHPVLLGQVAKNEFVRRNETTQKTYTRGEYNRSLKKYALNDCDDISRCIYVAANKIVYIDFTY